jgi:methionyl aminopeptidase
MIARTQEEIEILREGGRRLATYLETLRKMVRPGMSAKELDDKGLELILAGGDKPAFTGYASGKNGEKFPGCLCVSVNDAIVHSPGATNDVVFKDGDVVSLDFGLIHRGLYTDHATTVIAGKPHSADDEMLVRAAFEALQIGVDQARVGKTTGDIGHAVQKIAEKYDLGYPKNLSGHGVGKKIHEDPHVPNYGDPGMGTKLIEGLVIAIEPMFTLGTGDLYIDKDAFSYRTRDGSNSAHAEHTIIVTKNGPEILTKP